MTIQTHQVGTRSSSTIPPAFPHATHLTRVVLHPYGRGKGASFTLSMYDTGLTTPRIGDVPGVRWLGYRLYMHPHKGAKSVVLFQGSDLTTPESDLGEVMLALVNRLTTRPGDTENEATTERTPEQLHFLVTHAHAVRGEAQRRFAWAESLVHLRSDLEAVYHHRQLAAGPKHRMVLGVLEGMGRTRSEARRALESALGAHASAVPRIQVGGVTGDVYVQYPKGMQTVVQIVHPYLADNPLGETATFTTAATMAENDDIVDTWVAECERRVKSLAPSERRSARPRARASVPAQRVTIRAHA